VPPGPVGGPPAVVRSSRPIRSDLGLRRGASLRSATGSASAPPSGG